MNDNIDYLLGVDSSKKPGDIVEKQGVFYKVKSLFKSAINGVTYAVATPVKGLVSAITQPTGEMAKDAGKPLTAIAVIGVTGLVGYLLFKKQLFSKG